MPEQSPHSSDAKELLPIGVAVGTFIIGIALLRLAGDLRVEIELLHAHVEGHIQAVVLVSGGLHGMLHQGDSFRWNAVGG